ncbi:MAG: hypothetical protein GY865_02780, partial [candidate division Zixibacteria bacterium]|nr:hypothetical protein [candidate division Zixibacteria bacterium]
MRAILLSALFILMMTATVFATDSPIDMGSTIIGGSAFLSIESAEGSSLTTISLMPTFGYFVSPGFMM